MAGLSRFVIVPITGLALYAAGHLMAYRGTPDLGDLQTQRDRELAALATIERLSTKGFGASPAELETACDTLRTGEPDAFEREWMLAAAGILSYSACFFPTEAARWHIDHALSRFPDDPRLQLYRVLMRPEGYTVSNRPGVSPEYLSHSEGTGRVALGFPFIVRPHSYPPNARTIPESVRDLVRLSDDADVGDDARAHLAMLQFVLGRVDPGHAAARAVSPSADPLTRNLAGLAAGLALDASGRRDEATESYRTAVNAVPEAIASATALAAHLFLAGRRAEAATVLRRAYAADASVVDPWPCPITMGRQVPRRLAGLRTILGIPDRPADSSARTSRPDVESPARASTIVPPFPQPAPTSTAGVSGREQAAPVFRSTSAGVVVDVSVRMGKDPVAGLTAADFEIRDNGVLQTVQALSVGAVPLDVTLVIDTKDYRRPIMSGLQRADASVQMMSDVREIAAQLVAVDRLRVLVANLRPHEAVPMGTWATLPTERLDFKARGFSWWSGTITTALYDAAAAALMEPVAPERRSLVVVITNGIDGLSVLTSDLLLAVARESEALMHVARYDTSGEYSRARNPRAADLDTRSLLWPKNTTVIEDAARATGGTARHIGDTESTVNTFKRILDEFRQSYILTYQPTGVAPGGWHPIAVRVTRPGKYDVRARRGYFGG